MNKGGNKLDVGTDLGGGGLEEKGFPPIFSGG